MASAARSSSFLLAALIGVLFIAGACATARPVTAPVRTFEEKLAEIIQLEDRRILRETPPPTPPQTGRRGRVAAAPAVPDLVLLLADADPNVRCRASLAVGRVGLAEGVQPLLPLLKDPNPEVRQSAAFALGLIGDRSASAALQAALGDSSMVVRGRSAEALGLIGETAAAPAIANMVREAAAQGNVVGIEPDAEAWPMEPPQEAFRLGIYALVRLKAYEPLASVVVGGGGEPLTRWWPVAFALSRIEDKRAIPALTVLARGPGRYAQAFAARGLGVLGAEGATAALVPLVNAERLDPMVAVTAVRALAQIGGGEAFTALRALLDAPKLEPNVRLEVVTALGTLARSTSVGTTIVEAAEPLMDLAGDPWPSMRAEALKALASVDPDQFVFAISGLDPDPQWSVRAALATAVAGLPTEIAVPRLTAMLDDSDRRVVPAVLTGLVRVHAPDVESILRRHLDDSDVVIRMTAARELGELKPADGPQVFAQAYRKWSGDATYLARAAALTALSKYGAAAEETLRAALADSQWAVRLKAADLLTAINPAAAPDVARQIRPAPAQAAVAYGAPEIVAPQFSPHVYLETSKGLIQIELAVRDAPLTAMTIMALARKGFYTNVAFHRVVPNFVVQAGDPRGDGEGGPNFTIRDELNLRPYLRGSVGMALDWRDTGGSQFFITHSPQPHLDARYTLFGRVVKGMEVVDQLQQWDVIERVRVWDGVTLTSDRKTRGPYIKKGGD